MKSSITTTVFAILLVFYSCKKDNNTNTDGNNHFDTIKPLSYFPAFPNSYWVYDNNETLKVASQYEKHIYNTAGYTAVPEYDTLFLPKLILNNIYNKGDSTAFVKAYSISKESKSSYRDPTFKTILSLTKGEFIIGGAFQGHEIIGKTISTDTTIYIGNKKYENVIAVIIFDYACQTAGYSPEECATVREFYAENVGLIKRETRNFPLDTNFIKKIELVEYHIKDN